MKKLLLLLCALAISSSLTAWHWSKIVPSFAQSGYLDACGVSSVCKKNLKCTPLDGGGHRCQCPKELPTYDMKKEDCVKK